MLLSDLPNQCCQSFRLGRWAQSDQLDQQRPAFQLGRSVLSDQLIRSNQLAQLGPLDLLRLMRRRLDPLGQLARWDQ